MEEKSEHIIRREHFVAGVETGIDSERERIISLLALEVCDECYNIPIHYNCEFMALAIALIKGENA